MRPPDLARHVPHDPGWEALHGAGHMLIPRDGAGQKRKEGHQARHTPHQPVACKQGGQRLTWRTRKPRPADIMAQPYDTSPLADSEPGWEIQGLGSLRWPMPRGIGWLERPCDRVQRMDAQWVGVTLTGATVLGSVVVLIRSGLAQLRGEIQALAKQNREDIKQIREDIQRLATQHREDYGRLSAKAAETAERTARIEGVLLLHLDTGPQAKAPQAVHREGRQRLVKPTKADQGGSPGPHRPADYFPSRYLIGLPKGGVL